MMITQFKILTVGTALNLSGFFGLAYSDLLIPSILWIVLAIVAMSLGILCWRKISSQEFFFRISKIILKIFQPFFKKDTYILCDNLYEKHAGCVDAFCIFEEMQRRGIHSYYVIWKENLGYNRIKELTSLKNVITIKYSVRHNCSKNFEFWFKVFPHLFRTKVLLISFALYNPLVNRALFENKYITFHQVGHACTFFKVFPLIGPYFSHSTYNRYACWNEAEANLFMKYGKWEKENLPITGCCRCDQLKRITHKQKTIFIMFTWRTSFGPWNKTKFTTPLTKTKYYTGIKDFMHDEDFCKLMKDFQLKVLYSFHHSSLDQTVTVPDPKDLCGKGVEIVDPTDIASYIATSDLLVTDYSSVFFDFSFLSIPTVFFRPDFDDKTLLSYDKKDMAHVKELDKELFNVFYKKEDAIACIRKYVENNFILEDAHKKKLTKFFPIRKDITGNFIKYLDSIK